ncbi:MAG: MarR family transcriptional regulator [Candidatus Omnitrophota bacterium]
MTDQELQKFTSELNQIIPIIFREMFRRQTYLAKGKISPPQLLILDLLDKEGPCKMSDLAKLMSVSGPAITGLIDRLEKTKLVVRIFDVKDRRIIQINITPQGKRLLEKISQERQKLINEVFSKLTQKERNQYLAILKKVQTILLKNV